MSPGTDLELMRVALELARKAGEAGEVPVGAVIADADEILASAGNSPIARHDPTAHAEVLALRAACERVANYRLPGKTAYVTLEPCPMCAGALVHARIERLVFAAPDPKSGACGSVMDIARDPRLNHRLRVDAGLLADESAALLREFFEARR
jgi:tRNA(adenine34) deaminase